MLELLIKENLITVSNSLLISQKVICSEKQTALYRAQDPSFRAGCWADRIPSNTSRICAEEGAANKTDLSKSQL